jgi:hypothetical protein
MYPSSSNRRLAPHVSNSLCPQRDIRLERNDIIALVNTLQQVLAAFAFISFVLSPPVSKSSFKTHFPCSFLELFASATGSPPWPAAKMTPVRPPVQNRNLCRKCTELSCSVRTGDL